MAGRMFINADFGRLWSASFISQTGDTFYAIALAWLILERTGSPAVMGLLLVASYLPGFAISPWVGALLDRWDRKRILVAADVVRGIVVGLAAVVVLLGEIQVWQVMGVAVLLSLASAFFNPAVRVAVPRLVPDDRLVQANASLQTISGATSVAGPLLGAAFLGLTGYAGAFLFNALSFFVSGGLIAGLRTPLAPPSPEPVASKDDGVRGGFRFILGNPRLLVILALVFGVHLFFGSLAVALPFLARTLTGPGLFNLGLLEAALGAGLLAGSILLGRKDRRRLEGLLFQAIGGLGLGVLSLGLFRTFMVAPPYAYAGAMAVIGACVAMASVSWTTLLQRVVPDRMSGRVFALASAAGNIALPMAYGLCGLLLGALSLKTVLVGSGLAMLALGLLAGLVYVVTEARKLGTEASEAGPLA